MEKHCSCPACLHPRSLSLHLRWLLLYLLEACSCIKVAVVLFYGLHWGGSASPVALPTCIFQVVLQVYTAKSFSSNQTFNLCSAGVSLGLVKNIQSLCWEWSLGCFYLPVPFFRLSYMALFCVFWMIRTSKLSHFENLNLIVWRSSKH